MMGDMHLSELQVMLSMRLPKVGASLVALGHVSGNVFFKFILFCHFYAKKLVILHKRDIGDIFQL